MALLGIAYEGVVVEERLPFLKLRLRTGGYTHVRAQKGLGVGDRVKFYYEPSHGMIAEVLTIAEWEEEQHIRQQEIDHAAQERMLRDGSCDEVLTIEEEDEERLEEEGEPGDYEM
jgi:hypothetical protein